MRCLACNCILTEQEQRRKSAVTGDYIDLCNACLAPIAEDIPESLEAEDDIWDTLDGDDLEVPEA